MPDQISGITLPGDLLLFFFVKKARVFILTQRQVYIGR
jgi:hypothetical protein